MKSKLEAIANVAVILVALAVGGPVLERYIESARAPKQVAVGDHLPAIAGVDWSEHRHTLVLALNTGCHFCQDSVPFYQKLASSHAVARDLDVVAIYPNDVDSVRQFNTQRALPIRSIANARFEGLHIGGTPTLLLVDNAGWVERAWVGLLTARQELDVLAMISGTQN
jgi:hypothetical protein